MMIALYKTNKKGQMNYYYIHDYQGNLFAPYSFTAIWGRNMNSGKEKVFTFETRAAMDAKLKEIFKRRMRDSYKTLYTYPPNNNYQDILDDVVRLRAS